MRHSQHIKPKLQLSSVIALLSYSMMLVALSALSYSLITLAISAISQQIGLFYSTHGVGMSPGS